jgi:chromosome segregation ATPase
MATQEERIGALEQTTSEYRPVLRDFAYELSMVKGLIVTQTEITQELRRDMREVKQSLNTMDTRLERVEMMLSAIMERLPKAP